MFKKAQAKLDQHRKIVQLIDYQNKKQNREIVNNNTVKLTCFLPVSY